MDEQCNGMDIDGRRIRLDFSITQRDERIHEHAPTHAGSLHVKSIKYNNCITE